MNRVAADLPHAPQLMTVANQATAPMGPVMGGANIGQPYLLATLIDGGRTVRRTS